MKSTVKSRFSALKPDTLDFISPGVSNTVSKGQGWQHSTVQRSKILENVREIGRKQLKSLECEDETNLCYREKLVTSVSFSELEAPHENSDMSGRAHEIIDFRNLTPQVVFVPSIRKSFPKKFTLRKPKKAIKDLFIHRRHTHEKTIPQNTPCCAPLKEAKKPLRHREPSPTAFSDSSAEYGGTVCEDAASLKSFGSQAGCGEIFADDLGSCEGIFYALPNEGGCEPLSQIPTATSFQGGKESLASPGYTDSMSMYGLLRTLFRTIGQDSYPEPKSTESTILYGKHSNTKPKDVTTNPPNLEDTKNRKRGKVLTPKSDNQGSTSDEGYCDYLSPGPEDQSSKMSLSPVHSFDFPRDSCSGDALYELFCEPSPEVKPILDNETDLTECSDLPLSMYSFYVGAEENLSPLLARDFVGEDLLQSKWLGKDCFLKLCDTELSLAMGLVKWVKQGPVRCCPAKKKSSQSGDKQTEDLSQRPQMLLIGNQNPKSGFLTLNSEEDELHLKYTTNQGVPLTMHWPSQLDENKKMPSTGSQQTTSASGACFKIFNMDSPNFPHGNVSSPLLSSPASDTRSLCVFAINKELLCESCKNSLKVKAKDLHLCRSCMSHIEKIQTSDLRVGKQLLKPSLKPQLNQDLLSPSTTCNISSDISIASLVNQCAHQLSTVQIEDSTQTNVNLEQSRFEDEENKNKEHSQKNKKSRNNSRPLATKDKKHSLKRSSISGLHHKPCNVEVEKLGLVSHNNSHHLVLDSNATDAHSLGVGNKSHNRRPRSLPLMVSASHDLSCKYGCIELLNKAEKGTISNSRHRSKHRKNPALNENTFGEPTSECRCRMKK